MIQNTHIGLKIQKNNLSMCLYITKERYYLSFLFYMDIYEYEELYKTTIKRESIKREVN